MRTLDVSGSELFEPLPDEEIEEASPDESQDTLPEEPVTVSGNEIDFPGFYQPETLAGEGASLTEGALMEAIGYQTDVIFQGLLVLSLLLGILCGSSIIKGLWDWRD